MQDKDKYTTKYTSIDVFKMVLKGLQISTVMSHHPSERSATYIYLYILLFVVFYMVRIFIRSVLCIFLKSDNHIQILPSVSTIKHSGRTESFVGLHTDKCPTNVRPVPLYITHLLQLYYDLHVSLCTNLLVSRIWGRFLFTV
jgi:hypothetical protein